LRLLAALVATLLPVTLAAQRFASPGERVRLDLRSETMIVGQLFATTRDSITLRQCSGCETRRFSRADIMAVSRSMGRDASPADVPLFSAVGAIVGAVLGAAVGPRCHDGPCPRGLVIAPAAILGSVSATIIARKSTPERWVPALLP
jgi:hypothetical protein